MLDVVGIYGDAVRELDFGVGEIVKTVEQAGVANNTFIFFSSDNGAALVSKIHGNTIDNTRTLHAILPLASLRH